MLRSSSSGAAARFGLVLTVALAPSGSVAAQAPGTPQPPARPASTPSDTAPTAADLDSLVTGALAVSPTVKAAAARVEASRHRVAPAGLRPDPTLMAGVVNLPATRPSLSADEMTMTMVGVGQTIPYPGKLGLARRVQARELDAAEASLAAATRQVARDVKAAYHELAFLDRAFDVVERNQGVLVSLIKLTETRYGVGTAGQQDVLKARVEASRLAETAASLTEQRRAALARLNALLDRPSETPLARAAIPARVSRAAIADSAGEIRFVSAALGARVAGSPLPPLAELQVLAVRESPALREHEAMIAAQAARVELARKEALPDFDLSLQYGQRAAGRPDMVTAIVSVPLPVQRRRRQGELAQAAGAELAALRAEHHASVNDIRAEVARLVSELERERSQLAIYVRAVIPQGRAALTTATSSYQVARVEFLTVLADQAALFTYETEYFRVLADFATNLAELERVVGKEVLR